MKINLLNKELLEIWKRVKDRKTETILLFIGAIFVYLPFMAGQLNNADGFMWGVIYHGDDYFWENAQGRFILSWFDQWRDRMIQPSVIIGCCIIMLMILVNVLWEIFECSSRMERLLIGSLVLFSPSVANTFSYYYCADSYVLSYLFAVTAAALLICGRRLPSFCGAIAAIVISLGIYQAYVGVTVTICGIWVIRKALMKETKGKKLLQCMGRMASGGGCGIVIYLGLVHFLESVEYLCMTNTRGMDHMVAGALRQMTETIRTAYRVFYEYFFTDAIINNTWRLRGG